MIGFWYRLESDEFETHTAIVRRENMALLSRCFLILPGKKDKWQEMINSWNDPSLKAETDKVREEAGVHERTLSSVIEMNS